MIYLLTLLCSMCIQFATINPYNMAELNTTYQPYIDTVKSQIRANKGGFWWSYPWSKCVDVPNERWIVIKGYYNAQYKDVILVLCPKEDVQEGSSSINCSGYTINSNDIVDSVTVRFNGYYGFGYAISDSSIQNDMMVYGNTTYNFSEGSWSLLYCATPIYYNDSVVVDTFYKIPDISGHTQTGVNDYQDLQEPFTTVGFTGHSSVNNVDDSSTNNLLGNILNSIRGLGNLYVNGVNNIGHFIGGLWGNINNTINYVIEPIDKNVINDYIQGSTMGTLFTMVGGVFGDLILPDDPDDDIIIRWHLPTGYFDNAQGSFNLSDALDGSKHIWQPLLLTCLYGSFAIGIFRSMPSMLSGSSGIVGTIFGNNSNDSKTKKGGN